ncbi:hypothetical protein LCGC14_1043090 [marine sediment metagenome]|uniref:Uncharacterized protein n=1 Tax=marine sediment metagenome TaxID=412755 RepID=A0A0F9Q9G4_9ZZZZ
MRDLMLDLAWDLLVICFGCQAIYYGVQSYALEVGGEYFAAFGANGLMVMGVVFMGISLMGRVVMKQPQLEEIEG